MFLFIYHHSEVINFLHSEWILSHLNTNFHFLYLALHAKYTLLCSILGNRVGLPYSTRECKWTTHKLFLSPALRRLWVSALWTAARRGPLKQFTWPERNWILPSQNVGVAASLRWFHVVFTRGQFWPPGIVIACVCVCVCQSVCQSLACPRHNLGPVQARIAKFGPKMQKTLVKVPIVLGGNWPWPSRSNLTSKSELTPFWACPDHNSSPIHVRITKFGPEVENSLVKVLIILGGNWPWPSRSNLI